MTKQENCAHCGGKLEWINIPTFIKLDDDAERVRARIRGEKVEPPEYTPVQICSKCGKVKLTKAVMKLPLLQIEVLNKGKKLKDSRLRDKHG